MGAKISITADGDGAEVRAVLGEVRSWFQAWEACLSRFRPESELSQLNQRAGRSVAVSETLWAVLNAALAAARQTDDLITPTILPALETAGYDRTFASIQASQANETRDIYPAAIMESQFDVATRSVHFPENMRLDLGGFAKGWAADETARRLGATAPTLVDAGGDIAISGPRSDGSAWRVGIGHPQNPNKNLAVLKLASGGLATSGRNYRRWVKDGRMQHHLIDPRTGRPAETDVITASVVAASALEAEVAAKMALILGSQAGQVWLQEHHLNGILILENGQVLQNGDEILLPQAD